MSKYLASLFPEQIVNMMTKLKEATIDVGPQPVKWAKFTQIPWEAVLRIIATNTGDGQQNLSGMQLNESASQSSGEKQTSSSVPGHSTSLHPVDCLLLSTEIAFEIWLVKPNSHRTGSKAVFNLGVSQNTASYQSAGFPQVTNVEVECIYRKKEEAIDMVDFLHLNNVYLNPPQESFLSNLTRSNTHQKDIQEALLKAQAPSSQSSIDKKHCGLATEPLPKSSGRGTSDVDLLMDSANFGNNYNQSVESEEVPPFSVMCASKQQPLRQAPSLEDCGSTSSSSGSHASAQAGVFDHLAPLVGLVSAHATTMLKLYSLRTDKTIHALRFCSPITKFQSSSSITSSASGGAAVGGEGPKNQLFVLLQEGVLKVFNLQTMEQEISIKTFQIHPSKGVSMRSRFDSDLLAAAAFIPDFEISHNLYAYVYNEINEEDVMLELNKSVDSSLLGQYFLTKDAAKQLISLGHQSFNKVVNIMNVQKMLSIDSQNLQAMANAQSLNQAHCVCKAQEGKIQQQRLSGGESQASFSRNQTAMLDQTHHGHNRSANYSQLGVGLDGISGGDSSQMPHAYLGGRRSRVNSDQVQEDESLKPLQLKPTLSKENVISVRIRDLESSTLFAEIRPPFFKNISLVRFSPSGRYLIIGNENCQYFYIYEILPQTNQRFGHTSKSCQANFCHQERVRLAYSLFRGYTSTLVTDIQFVESASFPSDLRAGENLRDTAGAYSDKEQILVINSSNGTSHIYSLKKPKKVNETPIQKRVSGKSGQESENMIQKVIMLTPQTRFKYKSLIQQGALKIVSLVKQAPLISTSSSSSASSSSAHTSLGYRILTYTSKNEFYVIDLTKDLSRKKQLAQQRHLQHQQQNQPSSRILSQSRCDVDDIGISTTEVDPGEEAEAAAVSGGESSSMNAKREQGSAFHLRTTDTFELNIALQQLAKITKEQIKLRIRGFNPLRSEQSAVAATVLKEQFKGSTSAKGLQAAGTSRQHEWLKKHVEIQSFYPQMLMQQNFNPLLTFTDPTAEFLTASDNILDIDLQSQLRLLPKAPLIQLQADPLSNQIPASITNPYLQGPSQLYPPLQQPNAQALPFNYSYQSNPSTMMNAMVNPGHFNYSYTSGNPAQVEGEHQPGNNTTILSFDEANFRLEENKGEVDYPVSFIPSGDGEVKSQERKEETSGPRGFEMNLSQFLVDDANYFGGSGDHYQEQPSIIQKVQADLDEVDLNQGDDEGAQGINLSEYLDKAYDRFDPHSFKIPQSLSSQEPQLGKEEEEDLQISEDGGSQTPPPEQHVPREHDDFDFDDDEDDI